LLLSNFGFVAAHFAAGWVFVQDPFRNKPLVPEHQISNDTVNIFWMGSNMTGGFPPSVNEGDWQVSSPIVRM
jgi:hypothetical protein